MSEYVRIFLRDYAAQLRVGTEPHEKNGPQTIIINIECDAAAALRFDNPKEENLERAIDYTRVYHFIADELASMPHIPLLESVAEIIAAFCLGDPRVGRVRVRLEKPEILPDTTGAGVEIVRLRKAT